MDPSPIKQVQTHQGVIKTFQSNDVCQPRLYLSMFFEFLGNQSGIGWSWSQKPFPREGTRLLRLLGALEIDGV